MFDLASKICFRSFQTNHSWVTKIVLTRDNKRIISSESNSGACIWDLESSNLIRKLSHTYLTQDVAIDYISDCIITLSENCLWMWDIETATIAKPPMNNHNPAVNCLALTPDGMYIFSGSWESTIHVREMCSGALSERIKAVEEYICAIALTLDGRFLLAGGKEGGYAWDLSSGKLLAEFDLPGMVTCIIVTHDGTKAIIGSPNNPICFYEIPTGKRLFTLNNEYCGVKSLALSQDGSKLFAARRNVVEVWDLARQGRLDRLEIDYGADNDIIYILLSLDEKSLIASRKGGEVIVWNLEDKTFYSFRVVNGLSSYDSAPCLALTFDGQQLITGYADGMIRIWSTEDWSEIASISTPSGVRCMQYIKTPNGHQLVTGSADGCVRCWDLSNDLQAAALLWSSGQHRLFISQVSAAGIRGLSPANSQLLAQHNLANTESTSACFTVSVNGDVGIRAKADEARQAQAEALPTAGPAVYDYDLVARYQVNQEL